jgi:tetratricopeptide (TPR) repeat protein
MLSVCLVAASAAAGYATALGGGFVWDDRALILEDPQVRSLANLPRFFARDFFSHDADVRRWGYYRPLVTASYALDRAVWRERPFGFHLTNILLHAAASVLLLLLLRRWLGGSFVPPAAAILFATHPVHAESVAWIAGRTDVLCAVFILAALLAWERYRATDATTRASSAWLLASLVALTLALLAKEMAVVTPALFLLADPVRRNDRRAGATARGVGALLLACLPIALVLLVRSRVTSLAQSGAPAMPVGPFIATLLSTVRLYAVKLAFPVALDAYIQNPPLAHVADARALIGAIVATFAAWAVVDRRSPNALALAGGWFLVTLVPLSNLLRISAPADMGFPAAERFLYLPSVAACVAVAYGIERGARRLPRAVPVAIVAVIASLFLARTVARVADWRDDVTFFRVELATSPDAPLLHSALAQALRRAGDPAGALPHAERAVTLAGSDLSRRVYRNNLAGVYADLGELDRASAVLAEAEGGSVARATMAYNAGEIARARGDCAGAVGRYRDALALRPDHLLALLQSGTCLIALGRPGEAIDAFDRAARVDPRNVVALTNLGVLLAERGRPAEAEGPLRRALAADPANGNARIALALVLLLLGRTEDARAEARTAVSAEPENAKARVALARVLAAAGDANAARAEVDRVLARDPGDALALGLRKRLSEGGR